jgi:ferric-dicitrate binding protein FerR (iron transport regulator)
MASKPQTIEAYPAERERFVVEWKNAGCRLDMGKSRVRVKKLEQEPLKVIGRAVRRMTPGKFVKASEAGLPESVKKKRAEAEGSS